MRAFVDTNVLVYLFDRDEPIKQQLARTLIADLVAGRSLVTSAQVLSELYVTVTRKLAVPLSAEQATAAVGALCAFPVVPIDAALVRRAAARCHAEPLSYWDALILEAAVEAGADVVYSEDLHPGGSYRDITVRDPFA